MKTLSKLFIKFIKMQKPCLENKLCKNMNTMNLDSENNAINNIVKISPNAPAHTPSIKYQLKTPKGTRDYDPFQMAIRKKVINIVTTCFERHGAETIDTPVFELKETLTGKYGEEGGKLIYDLQDQGGEILSLRYDLTVPFARYMAMYAKHLKTGSGGLFKRYQIGKVYRRDNPSFAKGRLREFYQCDFDVASVSTGPTTAIDTMLQEVECLRIIVEILNDIGLHRITAPPTILKIENGIGGDRDNTSTDGVKSLKLVIKINHRQVLDGFLKVCCGLPEEKFQTACSSIDKLDKSPWEEVRREMIDVKGIDGGIVDKMQRYLVMKGRQELVEKLMEDPLLVSCPSAKQGLDELNILMKYCQMYDIGEQVILDLSLARGLDYYTGIIFEASLVGDDNQGGDYKSSKNNPLAAYEGIGSLAGGGRYDDLVGMFDPKHKKIPCVGFSLGLERIFAVLEKKIQNEKLKIRTKATDVFVVSAQKNLMPERVKLCVELWNAGINAEHLLKENPKILSQFQYCEENNIPIAIIVGESELRDGVIKIRDIQTRVEITIPKHQLLQEIKGRLNLADNYIRPTLRS